MGNFVHIKLYDDDHVGSSNQDKFYFPEFTGLIKDKEGNFTDEYIQHVKSSNFLHKLYDDDHVGPRCRFKM